jgi:hypothetical protein
MVVTSFLTFTLATTIGSIGFGGKTAYKAVFGDVTGLLPGNEIRIAGVRVGQVDSIELNDRQLAVVEFSLDGDRKIPRARSPGCATATSWASATSPSPRARAARAAARGGDAAAGPDPQRARPDRAVQRLPAAVPGARPADDQPGGLRAHPDPAGRGRHPGEPDGPHGLAHQHDRRPRRGHRPGAGQPRGGARDRRRARVRAGDLIVQLRRLAAGFARTARPSAARSTASATSPPRPPGCSTTSASRSARTSPSCAAWPPPSTRTRRSSTRRSSGCRPSST